MRLPTTCLLLGLIVSSVLPGYALAQGAKKAKSNPKPPSIRQDGPVDASSSNPATNMVPVLNTDGSLDIVWQRVDGKLMYSQFSAPDWTGNTREINGALDLFGGFTKDEQGNAYVLSARKENLDLRDANGQIRDPALRRPSILRLQRIPSGSVVADLTLNLNQRQFYESWGIYNPMDSGNGSSRLAYGGGSIAANFPHNIPGSDGFMHHTGALLAVDTNGKSTYNSGAGNHSAGNQIWYVGDSFVKLQEGDQGILMSRLKRNEEGTWNWSGDKLVYRHLAADPGNESDDVAEFVRCGNVVDAGDNYLFVFSGKRGEGWVWFGPESEVSPGVKGASLSVVLVPKDSFDDLPTFTWPENPVGEGIVTQHLTKSPNDSNLVRPRIVDTQDGLFTVVYEQWSADQKYESTHALRVDAAGQVKSFSPTPLRDNPRCQRNAESFLIGNQCGWIAGDNANKQIMLHLLSKNYRVKSIPLSLE